MSDPFGPEQLDPPPKIDETAFLGADALLWLFTHGDLPSRPPEKRGNLEEGLESDDDPLAYNI